MNNIVMNNIVIIFETMGSRAATGTGVFVRGRVEDRQEGFLGRSAGPLGGRWTVGQRHSRPRRGKGAEPPGTAGGGDTGRRRRWWSAYALVGLRRGVDGNGHGLRQGEMPDVSEISFRLLHHCASSVRRRRHHGIDIVAAETDKPKRIVDLAE